MSITDRDRLLENIRRIVEDEIRAVAGYPATYEYVIVSGSTDSLSAEPAPSDPPLDLPGLNQVPMRPSSIGHVTPLPGKRCHIVFLNGDLRKPSCTWVEPDTGQPIARTGDSVQVTITPADVATMVLANSGGPVTAGAPVTITGQVTGGSSRVTSE